MPAFITEGIFTDIIPSNQTKTRIAMESAGSIMFWALDHDAQGDLSRVNAIHQTVQEP